MDKPAIKPFGARLRVAALVDLPRSPQSGGHVKCWERLAVAAAHDNLPLDLTVYFSGEELTENLSHHARIRQLPPVFSTAKLKFLPYIPDHTDLAKYNPHLARELIQYDVIHTTDGFFAFSKTAEAISRRSHIPMTTSFHTDTPSYTRIFTKQIIRKAFKWVPPLRHVLIEDWKIPERQAHMMEGRLKRHVARCRTALVTRDEDHLLADAIIGKANVKHLRLGVDKDMFGANRRNRALIEEKYSIPPGRTVVLFVGRVDIGKNIYTLIGAMEKLIKEGAPVHLLTAGVGPATGNLQKRLAGHCSTPGFVKPEDLAELYASVDVLALSSEVEIRSMAVVEALQSGCPVLVSEKSGIIGLFNNTEAMQVVTGGPDNWADALRSLASNPAKQAHMREAALEYSRHHLASWQDVLAEDLFTVWRDAASQSQKKAA
jgi:glycosyltransferase involved in cell wall biosynthesis